MAMIDLNQLDAANFCNPQSPMEMKPDTMLLTAVNSSNLLSDPTTTASASFIGLGPSGGGQISPSHANYPPSHPLAGAKHMCSICGDRASGKHYGVYSCEGCKGFFKRTVRKELTYSCRESKQCLVDKSKRNRCQFCRYNKCISMGMKREAVQEERQRGSSNKIGGDDDDSVDGLGDMPAHLILEAEMICEKYEREQILTEMDGNIQTKLKSAADKQLLALVEWAKNIPHFTSLCVDDQVALLRGGWNELMIAGFSHRSIGIQNGIQLASGLIVTRENAHMSGVGEIFERVLRDLVSKMKELCVDKTELGSLRAIILFNPDVKGLKNIARVEQLRERVYGSLEEYTRSTHGARRFSKLLLRLPVLRAISLNCMEHLFFYKTIGESGLGVDAHLFDLLESSDN